MNTFGSKESGITNPASVGATRVLEDMMNIPGDTIRDDIKVTANISYYSNVEDSFLKYANLLETINEDAVKRKRKTGNRKKMMPSISIVPIYNGENILREKEFSKGKKINKKRLEEKAERGRGNEEEDKRLQWYGDPISFNEGWPSTNSRDTLRCFCINHNGITYHNDYLEWEISIAYLMDMQVDIFSITEANLDFNN